jgi:nicotinamide mononucleotide transporter
MIELFDINNIVIQIIGYPISFVEFIGTVFGLISVIYATRGNILTWSTGIINEIFLFILFYQVQLYADMFLQLYFFVLTIYGWYFWNKKTPDNKFSMLLLKERLIILAMIFFLTFFTGIIFKNIHTYLPEIFKFNASYPFIDSFVMILSIFATILLSKKKTETWVLWIIVDIICTFLFYIKGIYFLSMEYLLFLLLATYGFYNWKKQIKYD